MAGGEGGGGAETFFDRCLPEVFEHEVASVEYYDAPSGVVGSEIYFHAVIRANLCSESDFFRWLRDFELKSATKWIVRRTYPACTGKKLVFRREFECQHSDSNKSFRLLQHNPNRRHRGYACPATLDVRIKADGFRPRQADPYIARGLRAILQMHFVHSHPIEAPTAYSFLRALPEVKEAFEGYFQKGLSVKEALELHKERLLESCVFNSLQEQELLLANAAHNPKPSTVSWLYAKWRKANPQARSTIRPRSRTYFGPKPPRPSLTFHDNKADLISSEPPIEETKRISPELVVSNGAAEKLGRARNEELRTEAEMTLAEKLAEFGDGSAPFRHAITDFLHRLRNINSKHQMTTFLSPAEEPSPKRSRLAFKFISD